METPSFRHLIRVTPGDIDELGHVNNVIYVRWIQDVAAAHWKQVATPALMDQYAWVVLRHEIDYRNPAFLHDTVVGTTWVGEHNGARFERFVKLVAEKDNKVLAEARTMWCMLDSRSMRPVRISKDVLEVLGR
jgi:acyl-CoA thioester hydrolase